MIKIINKIESSIKVSLRKIDIGNLIRHKLVKDTSIYTIGAIFQKGIAFFLIPIYISILKPSEYGAIEFANTLNVVLGIIFSCGLIQVLFTEFYHLENDIRLSFINFIIKCYCLISIPAYSIALIVFIFWGDFLLGIRYDFLLLVLLVLTSFFTFFLGVLTTYLKLSGKALNQTIVSVLYGLLLAFLNITFVYFLKMGIKGVFLGNFIAILFVFFYTIYYLNHFKDENKMHSDFKNSFYKYLKIGIPFIFTSFSYWFLNGADRWIVLRLLGANDLGVYSLSSKFAMVLQPIIVLPLLDASIPFIFRRFSKGNYKINSLVVTLGIILLFSILSIVITYLARYIAKDSYERALPLVFFFIMGTGFSFIAQYVALPLVYHQKSKKLLFNILFAGVVNVILNMVLVRYFKLYGAAYAYLFANFIWALLTYIQAQHFVYNLKSD